MACGPTQLAVQTIDLALEANVIIFTSNNEKTILLSLDSLYIGAKLRNLIENEFSASVPKERIFIAASHTHYGPQLDPNKPKLGIMDSIHFNEVANSVIELIKDLLNKVSQPAEIFYSKFETNSTISRRLPRLIGGENGRIKFRKVFLGPNQTITPKVIGHVLQVSANSEVLAYIWQMPCHPTSLPKNSNHHSHFPGVIRNKLRQLERSEVPVVFLQGFSGDLRPKSIAKPFGFVGWMRRLVLGPWFSNFTSLGFQGWTESIWRELYSSLSNINENENRLNIIAVQSSRSLHALNYFIKTTNDNYGNLSIHCIRLGRLIIVGVSAEVPSDYVELLKLHIPNLDFVPVGCIDDVFGYAPTSEMLKIGGYESEGSRVFFDIKEYSEDFVLKFEKIITETVRNILE